MQRRLLRGGCGIIRVRFISPFTPRDRLDISITPTIDFHIRRRMCMQMQTPHLYSPLHSIPLDFLVLQIRTVRHTLPLSSQVLAAAFTFSTGKWQHSLRRAYSLELMRASHTHTYENIP